MSEEIKNGDQPVVNDEKPAQPSVVEQKPAEVFDVSAVPMPAVAPPAEPEIKEEESEEITVPESIFTPDFVVLFSGSFKSMAVLNTIANGDIIVRPHYAVVDPESSERIRVHGMVRKLMKVYNDPDKPKDEQIVQSLVEVIVPKKMMTSDTFNGDLIALVSKEVQKSGRGASAVAVGLTETYVDDAGEDWNHDHSLKDLQHHTPLKLFGMEQLADNDLEAMVCGLGSEHSKEFKVIFSLARHCHKEGDRACGECKRCKRKHKIMVKAFGGDNTKYRRKSPLWRVVKGLSKKKHHVHSKDIDEESSD